MVSVGKMVVVGGLSGMFKSFLSGAARVSIVILDGGVS
jgi:hypothetical protein